MREIKLKTILKNGAWTAFFLIAAFYVFYQTRGLIQGTKLALDKVRSGQTMSDPFLNLTGRAKNASHLALNGRKIFVDQNESFNELLLLQPGYNIITLKAADRFGRETEKELKLMLLENLDNNE